MSVKVSTWAWELQCVKGMTKLVLMALADSADDDGFCWPKLDTIASKASTSRSTVKRAIKELTDLDLLSVEHRERENGASATNYYWVNVGHNPDVYVQDVEGVKMDPSRTSGEQTEGGGVQNEPGEGFTGEPGRGSMVNPHNEPSFKPSNITTLTRLAGGVDAALADLSFGDLMKLDPLDRAEAMKQAGLKPEDFGKTPREMGINPRALGTNQRSSGDNPRAAGTNPRSHPATLADGDWEKLCEGWLLALGDSFERARRPWARLSMADQGLALKHARAFQQDKPKAHLTTYIRQKRWQSYEQAALKKKAGQLVFIEKGSPEWVAWCNYKRSAIYSSYNVEHRKEGCYQRSHWPPGFEADTKQAG